MSQAVKLSEHLLNDALQYSKVFSRSVPKQIEHWAKIGKIAEENPDMSYEDIKNILLGLADIENKNTSNYKFD